MDVMSTAKKLTLFNIQHETSDLITCPTMKEHHTETSFLIKRAYLDRRSLLQVKFLLHDNGTAENGKHVVAKEKGPLTVVFVLACT